MKTIKFDGEKYDWSMEECEDSDEFAVYLDLGNGHPECIGYADDDLAAREVVINELESQSAP